MIHLAVRQQLRESAVEAERPRAIVADDERMLWIRANAADVGLAEGDAAAEVERVAALAVGRDGRGRLAMA